AEILLSHRANALADGEGRSGAGGWGVQDMNGPLTFFDDEVVDQSAAGGDRLGAHAGTAGDEIVFANLRQKFLQRAHESFLTQGTIELAEASLPIFCRDRPEAFERN